MNARVCDRCNEVNTDEQLPGDWEMFEISGKLTHLCGKCSSIFWKFMEGKVG